MKKFAEILSTVCFVGFGFGIAGACIDYFDWLVALVIAIYLGLAIIFKYLAKTIDKD